MVKVPQNIDPIKVGKITLAVVIIVLAIVITWKIYRFINPKEDTGSQDIKADKNKLSYPLSQYEIFADIITEAVNYSNDDEEQIYNVFSQIKTLDDVKQLIITFGIRKYVSTFGFWKESGNLISTLRAKLDNSELEKINQIIAANGITFTI